MVRKKWLGRAALGFQAGQKLVLGRVYHFDRACHTNQYRIGPFAYESEVALDEVEFREFCHRRPAHFLEDQVTRLALVGPHPDEDQLDAGSFPDNATG